MCRSSQLDGSPEGSSEPRASHAWLSPGSADIHPVVSGAEPVIAPLSDNRLGDGATRLVIDCYQGRFSLAGVLDFEPRVKIGLLGLGLDQSQIRHCQHELADLLGVRRIFAFFR